MLSKTVPSLPVQNIEESAVFYQQRLGFTTLYQDDGFARVARDEAEVHLWAASDQGWKERAELARQPVCSGAESFIAGTASCRIEVDHVDELYAEMAAAAVLHPRDRGSVVDTAWGTREFATLDLEGNLLAFSRHQH